MTDLKSLASRYKISIPGMWKFVKKNLDEINSRGGAAVQTPAGWQFDDEAVKIIDELRGFNAVTLVEERESEEINRLKSEIDNLKTLLLAAQNDLIQTQKSLQQKSDALIESEKKYLLAETKSQSDDEKISALKLENERVKNELKTEVERLKNRSLIERILNRV